MDSTDRRLDRAATCTIVAIAAGRERLVDAHVEFVLQLIDRAGRSVAVPDVFRIYCRLHRLRAETAALLHHSLLVRPLRGTDETCDARAPLDWSRPAGLLERFEKRLRGRIDRELRRWVDRHTGFVRNRLLTVHFRNLLLLWQAMGIPRREEAVLDLYAENVSIDAAAYSVLLSGLLGHGFAPDRHGPVESIHGSRPTLVRTGPLAAHPGLGVILDAELHTA